MEIDEGITRRRSFRRFLKRIPQSIADVVERFFYQLGLNIAQRPLHWLIGCTVIILISLSGLYCFRQEKNPVKLWVPQDSEFVHDTDLLINRFGEGLRMETMILTADNVLEPEILVTLNEINKQVISANTRTKVFWTDICFKVPVLSGIVHRKKRSNDIREDDFFDLEPGQQFNETAFEPAVQADPELYCSIINELPKACLIQSIMEIWKYDTDLIAEQTKEDIIVALNKAKASPILGHPMNYSELLGGITKDDNGTIISAKAVKTQWVVHINFSRINMETFGNDAGTADWATDDILEWELSLLDVLERNAKLLQSQKDKNHTAAIWYEVGRSFGDITTTTIFQSFDKLAIGFILMFLYVVIILSDYTWVELRIYLAIVGLVCVGGAFIIAVSECSVLGLRYGPVHTSLPFLLLSLGVDDSFLIMASWREIHADKSNHNKPLHERVALMLGHAGSAISITSLTDVVAFVIGASTILPSLQSFCIYAAVGVFTTFLLQITLFVAFFTLDARRIEKKRNSVLPWIVHENFNPKLVNPQDEFSAKLITVLYTKIVLTKPGKLTTVLLTIIMTIAGIIGTLQLQVWFEPAWFLPMDTHLYQYIDARRTLYPDRGYDANILMSEIDYPAEFPKILNLTQHFESLSIIEAVKPWPIHFAEFVSTYYKKELRNTVLDQEEFHRYLSKFLFSRGGGKYQGNFRFDGNLSCGRETPRILLATIDFTFKRFHGPHEWIPAMDESKRVTKEFGIAGYVTVWSKMFSLWVTDKLLGPEVLRNLVLALICVMGMTGVLIAEPQTCFWILLCVLLTLLNVCGFMHFWGLTIDIASCIALELAIGLSVDYAAHVAHAFVHAESNTKTQDRMTRAQSAVRYVGAAVAYGAGSTLLALSMMAFTDSYVFHSFLKIFFLVIAFGLWHGLFLLPVILSTIGPRSLHPHKTQKSREKLEEAGKDVTSPLNEEPEN